MKHRRHGRHAAKSTGNCLSMLAAAVAFGLLNMGSASAAPVMPDKAALDANRDRLVNAGQLVEEQRNKKDFDQAGVSVGNADIQIEQEQRPSLDLPDTLKVQVNDFKITGQDIYSEESLKSLLADKKGKLVTFKDLQDGADTLSRYFRDKGYIAAHAYLPVQKIENGVVEYAVTVGRFDGITIQNNTKIHEGVIKRETAFLKKGDYLTRANLERAVWLLSDLAGADAKAVLTTGENPGTVHVTLDLNPHNGKQGLFTIDNYGNRSTGYNEYGVDYDFLNYFKATYRFGLDTQTRHRNQGQPNMESLFKDTYNADASTIAGATGSVTQQTTRQREINQDFFVTFDMPVNDFNINAVAGFNGNERRSSYLYGHVENLTIPTFFDLSNSSERPTVEQYSQKRRLYGIYGQAELAWKNMAYLTLTARNDWSSTLPKENRSFFYPGVTASFLFSELFPEDLKKTINFGKIRAAWGKTGNDANVYMTQSVYAQAASNSGGWASSAFPFAKTGTNAYTAGNTLGSLDLSPEMTTEFEIGLNMAFFQSRKQIFSLAMDPASGYTAMNTNLGKVGNKGIEALVTVVPVRTKDFEWSLTWNFTKNKNKVISLPEELGGEVNIYGFSGGTGLYAIEGEEMGIFKAYKTKTDDQGHIVVNSKGIPLQTDDLEKVGSMNYKYQMGLGTQLKYKGVSLGIDFDIRKGGLLFSRTADISYFTGNAIQTAYNDRNPFIIPNSVMSDGEGGYVENTIAMDATQIYNFWDAGGFLSDEAFLVDKSYVKLRSVVLSWELPKKWLAKTPLQGVRFSFFGNNLFLWTPSSNTFIDPELTSFGNDLEGNFGEYSANPSCRKLGFNVNVKF